MAPAIDPASLVACQVDSGDTAFMMMSMMLVFLMMPGLAFFEAGLVRERATLSIITQVFFGIMILSVVFFICGFTLTFGIDHGGFIGDFHAAAFANMPVGRCYARAPTIPAPLYGLYEMMFFAITPLLITGSFAERLSFKSFAVFIVVWSLVVYVPVAHWIWGNGWLAKHGVLDFAGGITVHVTAGAAALVSALYLGPRRSVMMSHVSKPHSIPLTLIGGALLWAGWFGFNAGSTLRSGGDASLVAINTHIAACTSGMTWVVLSIIQHRRVNLVGLINGAVAGLAGITPVCGYCTAPVAFGLGVAIGLVAEGAVAVIIHKGGVDDALEVSAVHGATGLFGALSIGFVASKSVNPDIMYEGVFYLGGGHLLAWQVLAIVVAGAWSGAFTYLILLGFDLIFGSARVSEQDELAGLDFALHDGHAYMQSVRVNSDPEAPTQPLLAHMAANPPRTLPNHGSTSVQAPSGKARLADDLSQMARRGELIGLRNAVAGGADPHGVTGSGRTLVHEAAEHNQSQVVRYLLEECRVNPNAVDNAGRTALDVARAHNAQSCVILLQRQSSINA